jgi:selenocysteine lyase/cysteine desulfurase
VSIGVLKITFSFEKYPLYSERMSNLKEYFLLDPSVVFLNHGSFGATPKPVFEAYQAWQLRLERQPVLFLGREYDRLLRESRETLGEYIHADADDLVYITNATQGVNIIARLARFGSTNTKHPQNCSESS